VSIRPPIVAGMFYAGDKLGLQREIERAFLHELGPGKIPAEKGTARSLKAVVCPHAGYMYSGHIAAHAFSAIYEDGEPDVFVILGPNHSGRGATAAVWSAGGWRTPLGVVPVDENVASAILNQSTHVQSDETAHIREHSIEVQLPFLQFLYPTTKIVPICVNTDPIYFKSFIGDQKRIKNAVDVSTEIGRAISSALDETGVDGLVIASSDFTHRESATSAQSKDHEAIEHALALNPTGLAQTVNTRSASICGYAPIIASISFAKERGVTEGKLLKYATSGDVTGSHAEVVAYGAIAF
jgi:AmmeMemoRadiSam system protein B